MKPRRIVVGFSPQPHRPPPLAAIAELAARHRAELLGLYIEDEALLGLAALPFAREVGYPSGARRELSSAALERALRASAEALHRDLERALLGRPVAWSFRVARASPVAALLAAAAEAPGPTLLLVPGADPRRDLRVVAAAALGEAALRAALDFERCPLLIVD